MFSPWASWATYGKVIFIALCKTRDGNLETIKAEQYAYRVSRSAKRELAPNARR
jgi:hypothetical protein